MNNYSLCMFKPDIHERSLEEKVYEMIWDSWLLIWKKIITNLTEKDIWILYYESKEMEYYRDIVAYLTRWRVELIIIHWTSALDSLNALVWDTDPAKSWKDTIRWRYWKNILENSVHSSNENRVDIEIKHIYNIFNIDQNYLWIKQ